MDIKSGSLFTGVGGFDLGFEQAGIETSWQVENDKYCQEILQYHWPHIERFGDVNEITGSDLRKVDIIHGGFPCQDVSVAGRREGLSGERTGLFYEFARIVGELSPTLVVLENVPGLLSSNGGRDMGAVLGTLGELGYGYAYRILDSQYFGVPQRRRRVFIVAHSGGVCPAEILFEPEGLCRDPETKQAARQDVTKESKGGVGIAGEGKDLAASLNARDWRGRPPSRSIGNIATGAVKKGGDPDENDATQNRIVTTFQASDYKNGQYEKVMRARPLTTSADRTRAAPIRICPTLQASGAGTSRPGGPGLGSEEKYVVLNRPVVFQERTRGLEVEHGNGSMVGALRAGDGGSSRSRKLIDSRSIPRRLTPRECERLQGFPDDWTKWGIDPDKMATYRSMLKSRIKGEKWLSSVTTKISDTQRYRQMGNAVTVPVAKWIGKRIMSYIKGEDLW